MGQTMSPEKNCRTNWYKFMFSLFQCVKFFTPIYNHCSFSSIWGHVILLGGLGIL